MKQLSLSLLSQTVVKLRKEKHITQVELSKKTGINRSILSRLETEDYMPSPNQLYALSEVLGFNIEKLFIDPDQHETDKFNTAKPYTIAVAGTGYVGLSLAVLLAQNNNVTAVDILPEKVEKLNQYISPIQDDYIEQYLAEVKAGTRQLNLTATTDGKKAYKNADFVIVAAPTNYDPKSNYFDCSAVESVINLVLESTQKNKKKPLKNLHLEKLML